MKNNGYSTCMLRGKEGKAPGSEEVASDLGLDDAFCRVLRFPALHTTGSSRFSRNMAEKVS